MVLAQSNRDFSAAQVDDRVPANPVVAKLSSKGLSKTFGPVAVLHNVHLDFFAGEIHAVVGENGAGKSTLMKILAGVLEPSRGEVWFDGRPVSTGNLRLMESLGVRLIHQELNLAEDLTVAENLFLGDEPRWGPFLDERKIFHRGKEVLAKIGADISLEARIGELRVSEKQMVEIAKAISQQASVLILDEPTAVLTRSEADRLFQIIKSSAAHGVAIIYISHRLEEVKRLAHRVTILRDGRLVVTERTAALSSDEIVRLMVGRSLDDLFPRKVTSCHPEVLLEVENLSVPGYVRNASFSLRRGEILGFAGLVGSGRTELFEGVMGLRKTSGGKILRNGTPADSLDYPGAVERMGVAYLPEDRKAKGLLLSFDSQTNYSLLGLRRFGSWLVNQRRERKAFDQAVDHLQIKVADRSMPVSRLSGGNQQKVVLAKVLGIEPEIIVFDEPTQGIDIGTKAQIYRWISDMAAEGRACVVISSELLEIIGLCHRVIVMRSSRIVANLEGDALTEDQIMLYATGVNPPTSIS
jgi:ribose transport system ATP-binding protein